MPISLISGHRNIKERRRAEEDFKLSKGRQERSRLQTLSSARRNGDRLSGYLLSFALFLRFRPFRLSPVYFKERWGQERRRGFLEGLLSPRDRSHREQNRTFRSYSLQGHRRPFESFTCSRYYLCTYAASVSTSFKAPSLPSFRASFLFSSFFLLSYTPVPLFISSVQLSGSIDFDTREFLFFLRYTLVAIFRLYCHRR